MDLGAILARDFSQCLHRAEDTRHCWNEEEFEVFAHAMNVRRYNRQNLGRMKLDLGPVRTVESPTLLELKNDLKYEFEL